MTRSLGGVGVTTTRRTWYVKVVGIGFYLLDPAFDWTVGMEALSPAYNIWTI